MELYKIIAYLLAGLIIGFIWFCARKIHCKLYSYFSIEKTKGKISQRIFMWISVWLIFIGLVCTLGSLIPSEDPPIEKIFGFLICLSITIIGFAILFTLKKINN